MVEEPDPSAIRTLADLGGQFDLLRRAQGRRQGKHRLSLQDMVTLVRRHRGREVPRSTLDNYLRGRTLAPPDVYEAILRVLGVPDAGLRPWADAWDRLDEARHPAPPGARGTPPPPSADPPPSLPDPVPSLPDPVPSPPDPPPDPVPVPPPTAAFSRRKRVVIASVAAAATALAVAYTALSLTPPTPPATSARQAAPAECTYLPVGSPVRVRPFPSFDTGARFESINDVHQPVTGSCSPIRAVTGTGTCGIGDSSADTWIKVLTPYAGWIFEPCLRLQRPAPPGR
ncbi:helix-turn-helix domain-containing protein [Actinomadura rubrisoli]|uniref:XRE family transcriptional regulator n=1 Tax=Actinomadura rubrisoli TaxID=2530368 RepID=A0A4R5CL58_9ACTN|nr:helix-turn-helix transcriptional regulator [Actinomadura rubrisoli]TDD98184.1 XRE family transcriptional regulator [Actinomadura rubrisoli]